MQLRGVVVVEGTSDRRALETLARRRGRDLERVPRPLDRVLTHVYEA